jgi:methylated-DNA-[protein]-cysteine S-methyltransferase
VRIQRVESPVGTLTLVGGDAGLRAVLFGRDGVPDGAVEGPHPVLEATARQLREWFAGERTAFDLPLSEQGTEFERAVWAKLREIPYGETRTYGDIARELGSVPRAVGRANGRNQISIIVPCHRVIGADGSLTGYAGGLDVKRALLEHEQGVGSLYGVPQPR